MTKPYYQLKNSLNFNHYVICFKQRPFETFRDVISVRDNLMTYDIDSSIRGALDMLIFETKEKAEEWLEPRIIEIIHGIRKDMDKNYVETEITKEKLQNYTNRYYRIMTLNQLWNNPNRWKEECEEGDLERENFMKELEGK